jgi:hypothetical protein
MADITDIIQQLELRPKCYITISAGQFTISRKDIKNPVNLVQKLSGGFTEIGAIQKLTIDSTRDAGIRRELNYRTAGKPVESFPGLPSYNLTLERVVLYKDTIPTAFGFIGDYDIIKQNIPLTLKLDMPGSILPGTTTTDAATTKTWYVYGVWFASNPMKFDVTDVNDIRIIQSVEAIAAGIVSA